METVVDCVSGYPKKYGNLFNSSDNNTVVWVNKFMVSNYRYDNEINLVLDLCKGENPTCLLGDNDSDGVVDDSMISDYSNLFTKIDADQSVQMAGVVCLNDQTMNQAVEERNHT